MTVFIDSNIPMYVAGREHPNKEPAMRILEGIRTGEIEACTSTEVLQEILYRYTGLGRIDLAVQVYELFVDICPVVYPVTLADTDLSKELLQQVPDIGARDAVHASVMLNNNVEAIATFDRGFDAIPRIERVSRSSRLDPFA